MNKKSTYAIYFWNEETDHEIIVVFQADDWFHAEKMSKNKSIDGYIRGEHIFIDARSEFGDATVISLNDI